MPPAASGIFVMRNQNSVPRRVVKKLRRVEVVAHGPHEQSRFGFHGATRPQAVVRLCHNIGEPRRRLRK